MPDTTATMRTEAGGTTAPLALAAHPALVVVAQASGKGIGERLVFDRGAGSVVLGRGGTVFEGGVLDDKRISRQHVEVSLAGGCLRVRDLGSRNGTQVNGEPTKEARLERGDLLRIGDLVLLFEDVVRAQLSLATPSVVSRSAAMVQFWSELHIAAENDVTVLLHGPPGTGKEVAARELHIRSGRKGDFVAVNCATLVDSLVVSELFGHTRGAFSGAADERAGLVAAAENGTLFLDEVGDASPALQAALLRLLEQREYRRVGEETLRTTNARFVSASHVSLAKAVEESRFRADLFGRLDRWQLTLPPLCERREDIMPIALQLGRERHGAPVVFRSELATALVRYNWPGNVRELAAVVDQAVLSAMGSSEINLTESLRRRFTTVALPEASSPLPAPTASPTDDDLVAALDAAGGQMKAAAQRLGVSRATLYRWLGERGLSVEELRRRAEARRG